MYVPCPGQKCPGSHVRRSSQTAARQRVNKRLGIWPEPCVSRLRPYRENPVYRSNPAISSAALVLAAAVAPISLAAAQQSDLTVSPFVSYLPAMGGNPLA